MKDVQPMEASEVRRLDVLSAGWNPFSVDEHLWHGCPGHEWERFDFDLNRGLGVARLERVTRCGRCGAPRCDTTRRLGPVELMKVVTIVGRHRDVAATGTWSRRPARTTPSCSTGGAPSSVITSEITTSWS